MFRQIKQLVSESLVYGVSSIVTRFLSFFLIPVYTKIFEPSDYGTLSLVNTTFVLIGILVVFGLDSAAAIYYYDQEGEERKKPISTWFWAQTIFAAIFFATVFLFQNIMATEILGDQETGIYFFLASLNILFTTLPLIAVNWFRMQRKPVHCVLFTLGNSLLVISGNIVAVVILRMGLLGVYLSTLIASVIFSIVAWYYLKDWIRIAFFDISLLKKMLRFSAPLIPASFAYWIVNSAAVYFVEFYCSRTEVGLYQIGNSLASGMFLVIGAFQLAWGPFAFSIQKEENARNIYAKVLVLYTLVTCFLFICLAVFSKEILLVLTTRNYVDAYLVGAILAFNFVLGGLNYIAAIGLNLTKTNNPYAYAISGAAILTIVLYFLLIPDFGIEGAAIATVTGQLIVPIYMFYKAQKLFKIPYNFKKTTTMFLLSLTWAFVGNMVFAESIVVMLVTKMLIIGAFLCLLILMNKNSVLDLVKRIKAKRGASLSENAVESPKE